MPRKKSKEDKKQPKLMEWVGDPTSHGPLSQAARKQHLQREIGKLLKVRKDIENRQLEEERIIKRIIKLQIDEDKLHPHEEKQHQESDEEYLILTADESLQIESPSMFKLCLGDYGELYINHKSMSADQVKEAEVMEEKPIEAVSRAATDAHVKEWRENGSLSSQLLTDYSNNFLQYLQQMQYNADSIQTTPF